MVYEEHFDCSAFWAVCKQLSLDVEFVPSESLLLYDPGQIFIIQIKLTA